MGFPKGHHVDLLLRAVSQQLPLGEMRMALHLVHRRADPAGLQHSAQPRDAVVGDADLPVKVRRWGTLCPHADNVRYLRTDLTSPRVPNGFRKAT